jgi:hypothetical protein
MRQDRADRERAMSTAYPPERHADALALAQLLRDSLAAGAEREALHLRLSELPAQLRVGPRRELLDAALAPALQPARSRLFALPNGDLVAISPRQGAPMRQAQRALGALLGMPSAAPLLALPRDTLTLMAAVDAAIAADVPIPPRSKDTTPDPAAPFTIDDLAALERALQTADLSFFLQTRPVNRLVPGSPPTPAWEELRLDWPALRAALRLDSDPATAPCLGRRLRRRIEQRLLASMADPLELRQRGPIGLCLSAATLGEPAFLHIDALFGAAQRARVVIALPIADLLADAEGFAFARRFLRVRGYRVALDCRGARDLALLTAATLGDDLLRLPWAPDLPAQAALLPPNRGQVVLMGADRPAALGWGWEEGISLFEGRLLSLFAPGE